MKKKTTIRLLLLVAGWSPLPAAVVGAQEAVGGSTKPVEAAAESAPRELHLSVTGLVDERTEAVRDALLALTTEVYVCKPCKVEAPITGECSACGGPLEASTCKLFTEAELSAKNSRIDLTVTPMATLHLSRVQELLEENLVKLDAKRLRIDGRARLVVHRSSGEDPSLVAKALGDSKLFEHVDKPAVHEGEDLVVTVRAGAKAPSWTEVSAVLEGLEAELVDVVWPPRAVRS